MKRVCNHHSELQFNCEVIFSLNLQKLLLETFMYATIRFALCSRLHDDNLRTSPKHIVFLSKLLLLFQICHICRADHPLVETREVGTMAVVTSRCQNPKCPKKENVWYSQPYMPGTKTPAGNFLLCFAILLSGGSASKVFQIFQHMGLACISLCTFFHHQRVSNSKAK